MAWDFQHGVSSFWEAVEFVIHIHHPKNSPQKTKHGTLKNDVWKMNFSFLQWFLFSGRALRQPFIFGGWVEKLWVFESTFKNAKPVETLNQPVLKRGFSFLLDELVRKWPKIVDDSGCT